MCSPTFMIFSHFIRDAAEFAFGILRYLCSRTEIRNKLYFGVDDEMKVNNLRFMEYFIKVSVRCQHMETRGRDG